MGEIIAVVNQKGGVGKTTTAVNLCAGLHAAGKRVLLCDFDPQANATSGMGVDKRKVKASVYQLLTGERTSAEVRKTTPYGDLLPATPALAGAGVELAGVERREFVLRDALAPWRRTTITSSSTARPPWSCSPSTACAPPGASWCRCSANTTPWRAFPI